MPNKVAAEPASMEALNRRTHVAERKLYPAEIRYPDNTVQTFKIHESAKGRILLDLATDFLKLSSDDRQYFELTYLKPKTNEPRFLNNERAVAKQSDIRNWKFTFTFKFFPQEPSVLSLKSRKFLVEQCRSDIYSRKIPADTETQAQLASYIAQAELGDYKPSDTYGHYVRNGRFASSVDYDFVNAVQEYHLRRTGQKEHEAYMFYLNYCKNLPLYGIHCYETKDFDGDSPIEVGVGARGLVTYTQDKGVTRSFGWKLIKRISYRRKIFYVKLVDDLPETERVLRGKTIALKLLSTSHAQRFYKLAVEQHEFYRLVKSESKLKSKPTLIRWVSKRFQKKVPQREEAKNCALDFCEDQLEAEAEYFSQPPTTVEENQEVNHDAELIRAIFEATKLNPAVVVESYVENTKNE
ncbi:hypothetical protein L596_007917 [Steinernema carpocapsae]|uniref:FERM domain-containing protein n=1 Tax=Steinernema carpocapsae TaxID=34508 RepID=A0A4U5PBE5_STECR|nr:hypothetical protein L596_007917 [Steinernema carpocapsae]